MCIRTTSCAIALVANAALATPAPTETRIGAIFDPTGALDIYGIQQMNALDLAVAEINESG